MLQVKWLKVKVLVAHLWTLCTVACQALLSMEFSGQEYWSGLPFPSPGESSQPRDQTQVSALQADSLLYKPPGMQVSLIESVEGLNRKKLPDLPARERVLSADGLPTQTAVLPWVSSTISWFHEPLQSFSPQVYFLISSPSLPTTFLSCFSGKP